MNIELLTEHRLEFLSLKGGCTGWSQSTLVKMRQCHIVGNHMSRLNYGSMRTAAFIYSVHVLSLVTDNTLLESTEGTRTTVETIS